MCDDAFRIRSKKQKPIATCTDTIRYGCRSEMIYPFKKPYKDLREDAETLDFRRDNRNDIREIDAFAQK